MSKWESRINRAKTRDERYERVCDMIREIGLAVGDAMKHEPPDRFVPMYAFQLGLMGIRVKGAKGRKGDVAEAFNDAGLMAVSLLCASLDPLNLPEDNTAFVRAFYEGVRDRVDSAS